MQTFRLELDKKCQQSVMTVARSCVNIPGDVISVNIVICGISIIAPASEADVTLPWSHLNHQDWIKINLRVTE